jgi:hypothetical protein
VIEFQMDRAGIYMTLSQLEYDKGNGDAVLSHLRQACDILQPIAKRFPAVPRYQHDLAVSLRELAIQQDAHRQKAEARANLAESEKILELLVAKYPKETQYSEALHVTQDVQLRP